MSVVRYLAGSAFQSTPGTVRFILSDAPRTSSATCKEGGKESFEIRKRRSKQGKKKPVI